MLAIPLHPEPVELPHLIQDAEELRRIREHLLDRLAAPSRNGPIDAPATDRARVDAEPEGDVPVGPPGLAHAIEERGVPRDSGRAIMARDRS